MPIPVIPQSELNVRPINWLGLDRRFMNPGELEVLVALVRSAKPEVMVEIGCNVGRTAKAMLSHVPSLMRYVGVDVNWGYVPAKPVQANEVPRAPGHMVKGDPRFELVLSRNGSLDLGLFDLPKCQVMFIDGDHGRDAVLHDSGLARALVQRDGIIIWHDYHDLGTVDVRQVLDGFYQVGADLYHVEGTWLVFERRRR
jgi:predicted O-methyltransferase YrrM